MGYGNFQSDVKKPANFRLCNVSSYTIELLEILADQPSMHVLFIPGNPGVVTFYTDFVELLFELLGGAASITAIGHIGHTKKNWERGRLFSLQEQIDHKMDFIKQELQNTEIPLILVGHSIGSYISLQMLRRSPEKVLYYIGLYPFLALNLQSKKQIIIGKIAMSKVLSTSASFLVASFGLLPRWIFRLIVKNILGKSWSNAAVEAACSHLPQYHVMRNVLFMAMTEFQKEFYNSTKAITVSQLAETPDWAFMRENQDKIAFLFSTDDHWGPLQLLDEMEDSIMNKLDTSIENKIPFFWAKRIKYSNALAIGINILGVPVFQSLSINNTMILFFHVSVAKIAKQVPGASLSIEREGHTHGFSCTEAGSLWVAQHIASLIKNRLSDSSQ